MNLDTYNIRYQLSMTSQAIYTVSALNEYEAFLAFYKAIGNYRILAWQLEGDRWMEIS